MKTESVHEHHPALHHAALMDAAKRHALALRAEAIDAFWSDLAGLLNRAWRRLRRSGASFGPAPEASPCLR